MQVLEHWYGTPDLKPDQEDRSYLYKELADGIRVAALFQGYKGSSMAARCAYSLNLEHASLDPVDLFGCQRGIAGGH